MYKLTSTEHYLIQCLYIIIKKYIDVGNLSTLENERFDGKILPTLHGTKTLSKLIRYYTSAFTEMSLSVENNQVLLTYMDITSRAEFITTPYINNICTQIKDLSKKHIPVVEYAILDEIIEKNNISAPIKKLILSLTIDANKKPTKKDVADLKTLELLHKK